jgi:3-hydroxyacyl-[acyl-carrier-protein] dehydratase
VREAAPAPLRAVDAMRVREAGRTATAVKRVVADDPYLAGHFPGAPVYPGVFVVESARQAVAGLLGTPVTLVAVVEARFTAPLRPGDLLCLDVECEPADGGPVRARARASDATGAPTGHCVIEVAVCGNA